MSWALSKRRESDAEDVPMAGQCTTCMSSLRPSDEADLHGNCPPCAELATEIDAVMVEIEGDDSDLASLWADIDFDA